MGAGSNDWRELREFAGVELTQSFILSWEMIGDTLSIDVDVCLGPKHPFYEEPRPAEGRCIRPATLEFPNCTSILGDSVDETLEMPYITAGLSHGRIDDFKRVGDGQYRIAGSFGVIRIDAERPLLKLKDAAV